MLADSGLRDDELPGDRGIGVSLGHQCEDLAFARRQLGQRVTATAHELADDLRVDDRPAGGDPAQRVDELLDVADAVLEQVADVPAVPGDLLIPASVAGGHTGAPTGYSQILVSGGSQRELAALTAAHPGIRLASRAVYNAEVAQNTGQNSLGDNVILGVIAALAAVTMINTLAVSTTERRSQVRLLSRIGATTRQLAGAFRWQALFITVTGIAAGGAVCAGTLIGLDRAVTGSAVPYIQAASAALIVSAVAALTFAAIMTSFAAMMPRRP